MHPSASLFVVLGMANVTLAVAIALVVGHARAARVTGAARGTTTGFALAVAGWVVLVGVLGASGLLHREDVRPPPLAPVVLVGLVLAAVAARSSVGSRLARGLPLAALVGFHAFRLPLELVMHRAAAEGTMPAQMTFGGWNYDIVSGATAVVVAWLVARGTAPRWLVMGWAVLSSALLAVIVVVAVASTPLFAAFGSTPDRLNTWVGWFPFAWLPGVLVPAALFGQLVVFRRLAADRVSAPPAEQARQARPARPSRA